MPLYFCGMVYGRFWLAEIELQQMDSDYWRIEKIVKTIFQSHDDTEKVAFQYWMQEKEKRQKTSDNYQTAISLLSASIKSKQMEFEKHAEELAEIYERLWKEHQKRFEDQYKKGE